MTDCLATKIQFLSGSIRSKLLRVTDARNWIVFVIGRPLILIAETKQDFSNYESWKIQGIKGLLPSVFLTVDAWSKMENICQGVPGMISPWHF